MVYNACCIVGLAMAVVSCMSLVVRVLGAESQRDDTRSYGIDQREAWTTSRITGSPNPAPPYRIERLFPKLQFTDPVTLTKAPGTERLFVVELAGKILSFENRTNCEQADLVFDVAVAHPEVDTESLKVYGLAFHPDFESNRYCYLCYVIGAKLAHGTRVSRFDVSASDPPQIDPASEEVLITWLSGGHNGGCLKFGLDGYLYISTGDGGKPFPPDPLMSGQDVGNLRSCILRIDVDREDGDRHYSIPEDNPFVDLEGARGEIWAYGFRNPWRMSFDPANGDLWVGDVGWELWEMIDRVERGGNYGWSLVEGRQPVYQERMRGPTPVLPPTVEHSHIESRSITGGHVYRGKRLKNLIGAYVYGDYVTGKIWSVRHDGNKVTSQKELVDTPLQIICFGVDQADELTVVDYLGGLYRLVANEKSSTNLEFPRRLSETGLFASVKDHQLAPGVIPYSINAEPWADGATAERFVALPGKTQLGIYDSTNKDLGIFKGAWRFPADSALAKTIYLETESGESVARRRIETQILHFDKDTWRPYTYVWDDEQTDATLAPAEGLDRTFTVIDADAPGGRRNQTWHVAAQSECLLCHRTRGGLIYGFNPRQLNKDHAYKGVIDNQLRTLALMGLFEKPAQEYPEPIPSPFDESVSLEQRARAYLHINCAHCHRRGGGGTAAIELQYDLALKRTHLLEARPTQGTFGIHAAQVVAPGDPFRSVLYYRMAKVGRGRMPYFGSSLVDQAGLRLIHDWIHQLPPGKSPTPESVSRQSTAIRRLLSSLNTIEEESEKVHGETIDELLSSTKGALSLLQAIDDDSLSETVELRAIDHAIAHEDIRVREFFERFIPEEERTKRLEAVVKVADILSMEGSRELGEMVFFKTAGCKNCHRIGQEGTPLGPELTQIGKKYNRAQLLESILKPSKEIDPRFTAYVVETVEGRVLNGLLVSKNDREVLLKNMQSEIVRISAKDIEFMAPQQKSLMPELLLQDMTAGQVADLLAFLQTLQ